MFGDNSIAYPVYTYGSEYQETVWDEVYNYYDVKNDKSNREKCDIETSIRYENKTYNECKELCTSDVTDDGYKKCVGIYGDLDPDNPDTIISNGHCFICPERIHSYDYVLNNIKSQESANKKASNVWTNFVTGIHLKTVKTPSEENDSAHAYLGKFYITNKY